MRQVLILAFLAAGLVGALASDVPNYAVAQSCARFAAYAVGGAVEKRGKLEKDCLLDQQKAYEQLKTDWKAVTDTDRAMCLRMTGEAANYRSLGNCISRMAGRRLGRSGTVPRAATPN